LKLTAVDVWLEKPARSAVLLAGIFILIFLTIMTAIPINVTGPFDARTFEPAEGVRLEYSPAGAALEPVTAPGQIMAMAPNGRAAIISVSIWFLILAGCIAAVGRLPGNHWRVNRRVIAGTLAAIVSGLFVLVLYGTFTVLVRIPNWRAVVQDTDIVLAELQTHTFGSHDGLISARDCLRWHGQRGCSVVAVTEHNFPEESLKAAALAENDESLPAVLPGVEIHIDNELGYVVAIGPREAFLRNTFDRQRIPFMPYFHQTYEGVVLALEYSINTGMVEQLCDAGMDGFSVASDGHPNASIIHRKEVLAVAEAHHLPVVAWSDWHGISGILRTWTAIRVPNAAELSRQQRASAVLDALRRHDWSNITPLTVGRIGRVTPARVIFAPFTESVRYALGLSPARLLAWWIWAVVLFLLVTVLLHLGIRPGKTIRGAAQAAMGIAVLISCFRFFIAYALGQTTHFFPVYIGLMALPLGIAGVLLGVIDIRFAAIRRQIKTLH
jgi:hypothetical protein